MRMISVSYAALSRFVHLVVLTLVTVMFHVSPASAVPAHAPLILAFGDSLTAGYRLRPEDSFAAQLEAALKAEGRNVRVHNAGVSGDTTAGGKARLGWVLAGLKQTPDLVILELGANDMLRGVDPKVTRANLEAMLVELKKRGIPVVLAGMLAMSNLGVDYSAAFNRIYPNLAKTHGAALYPFFLKDVAFNRPLLLDDGLHPNKAGVARIVRNILPTVRKALDVLPKLRAAPSSIATPAKAATGASPVRRH